MNRIPGICPEDVLAATRAVARGASMARIIRGATLACAYRAHDNRIHPHYGDGSIMAAANHISAQMPRPITPIRTDSPEWFDALATVAGALRDLRALETQEAA